MLSQIMSQSLRNTTVPPRPGRVTGPARAGLKAAPVSAPHQDAEDQGQADRDRREMGGAAGNRGARLLGPKDGAPRSRGGDGLDETIGQSLFHDLPLTAHIARDPGISRVLLGPKIRRFLASVCEKPRTTVCYITSYYKMFYAKWRLTTNAGER